MQALRRRFAALLFLGACAAALAAHAAGPGKVIVRSAMGGFILGYDIDPSGTEGLLAEAVTLGDGNHDVAVETFDQATGKIIKIVRRQRDSKNDYVAFGIFGQVGLVEFEHVSDLFVDKRVYHLMDPIDGNAFTGLWTPPFKKASDIISAAAQSLGDAETAFLGFKNNGSDTSSYVFSSNVGANTFGPLTKVTDTVFDWPHSPVIAVDTVRHRAVLGSSNGCFGCLSFLRTVDLVTSEQHSQAGPGKGFVNGIAVDPNTNIACTTTEDDFSVQFWDLDKGTVTMVTLPGASSQAQSGSAVAVDPLHKLFLIGQPISSTAADGSSIHVYDEKGNLVKSLNGFSLPASPANMALNPSERRGFVIVTPDLNTLQSFKY
ncbi:MAG TPA: hypothetical protein VGQ91_00340 [Ideonella sp.]|jgi:hypothetical protein|nr:hypothetical protein [Ideonella sp.]